MLGDLKLAMRTLGRSRGFAIAAIGVLALGIGATATVFNVVDAVLLRPLPFPNASRLAVITSVHPKRGIDRGGASFPDINDWRTRLSAFDGIAAYLGSNVSVSGAGDAERVSAVLVSEDFFRVMGVAPAVGRTFSNAEWKPGGPKVAILSDGLWRRRFGSDARVVGRPVTLDGASFEVVGVMPPGFDFPNVEIWAPFTFPPEVATRQEHALDVVARLREGVSLRAAQVQLDALNRQLEREYPVTNDGWQARISSLHDDLAMDFRSGLYLLAGAVALVLLITCANVANLVLARNTARRRELAVRFALGGSHRQIARQLLAESAIVAAAGAAAGMLISLWGIRLVRVAIPVEIPRWIHFGVDARTVAFSLTVAAVIALVLGVMPSVYVSDRTLADTLRDAGRSGTGRRARSRRVLVVSEIAVSVVLLIGALLLTQSFARLQHADPGFDANGVLTLRVSLPEARYPNDSSIVQFHDRLHSQLRVLPGVTSTASVLTLPLSAQNIYTSVSIEGQPQPPAQTLFAHRQSVTPDYFSVMRIPLVTGRRFTEADGSTAPLVAIVNEKFAGSHWTRGNAVGQRFKLGRADEKAPWITIVGIASDIKQFGVREGTTEGIYLPVAQSAPRTATIAIRVAADPATLAAPARKAIARLDPELAVFGVATMPEILARSIWQPRLQAMLVSTFAAIALVLAAVGVYGVISYAVAQRTREIGVRMALGAQPSLVLGLVIGQGVRLTLVGVALGITGALAGSRLLQKLLFGVGVHDPATFIGVPFVLFVIAITACYIPARRAAGVDPSIALRADQ